MTYFFLHSACLLPQHSCPSDGSLLTYLCSGDASSGGGVINHPYRCHGGIGHRTPIPSLFSAGPTFIVFASTPLELMARVSPNQPGDKTITNGGGCNCAAVKPIPSHVFWG